MRKLILLSGFLFWGMILHGQIPFVCDGDFFLSLGNGGNTGFYRVKVDPATGSVTFLGFSPSNNSGNTINAMGYRVVDNLIYGVNPGTGQIFSIGSDGVAYQVGSFQNTPQYSYYAGDVTPDGTELVVLGAGGNPNRSREVATISFLNFSVSKQTMTLTSGAVSDVNCADIAFDPLTGILYGYDSRDRRLITIDPATGVIDDSFPASQGANVLGAMYFDAFGQLHGYGTPSGGSTQNTYFDIDKGTGILTPITTGPSASSNDGASCPYTIEIKHWVAPDSIKSCDTVLYFVKVANNSGGPKGGLDIITDLPNGLTIDQIVYNPYGGTVVSGSGTDRLEIQNITVDVGQDSLVFTVITEPLTFGVFASQAKLLGLPPALGDSAFSDDPFTPPFLDSTRLRIAADTVILPTQSLEFCQGDALTLTTSDPDALLFKWSDGSTGSSLTITQPGTYWVNATECDITVDTFNIIEWPLPIIDAGADQSICFGETANLSASGAFSYTWSQLGSPTTISTSPNPVLAPGDTTTYIVTGTDVNGCQNRDTVQINVKPLPIINAGIDTTICLYESVVLGNSSNPPGNYTWTPDTNLASTGSFPFFVPSSAGNFPITLTLTDTFGCTQTDVVNVRVNDFQLTINPTDVDCFGNDNGAATLIGSGISPYTYIWKAGGNDIQSGTQTNFPLSIDSLAPGNYSVVVIDGNGCIDSLDFNIIQPNTPLEALIQSTQNVDCFGNANGALTGAGVGGTPPYVFSITGGFSYQVSPVFSGLGATQYTLQVRDGNGCIATITDTLTSPTGLFGSLLGKKDVRCFGLSDGFIEIAGAGGTQPYTLSLDGNNFFNSLSLNSLGPGQDTVLMQDANSCVVAIPFEIFEPPALSGSPIYSQNINCFGFQTGIIELKASGGSLPYTFSVDGSNYQSDSLFTGLPAGSYQTVVQDDSLCQDTIPIVLTEPNELELANLDQKNIDCFGNTNGAVLTDATGGTGPYTFTMDSLNFQATGFFDTLTVGSYVVTVVDDSSCVTRLPVQITEPPLLEIRIQDLANVACFGDSTGFVGLEATGGSPDYTYSLDSLDFQNDPLFPQLAAGTYSFWVMDDSSCVTRVDTEITESLLLEFSLVNQVNIDCFGNDNGAVAFSVEGGVPAYALSLDGGMPQSSLLFENLSPGLHEVVVTDDSACTQSLTVDIFEPPLLTLSMEKTDVTCFDFADGSATVIADGGTPEFRYHWSTVPTQTAAQATNLSGGTYQVIVTDANGCSDTASSFIFEPDSLTLTLDPNAVVESYCDWPNGSAAVFTSGGRLPHTISWNGRNSLEGASVDELYGGPYQVTVTDSVGCVTRLDVDIPETPPAIPLFESNPSWREAILLSQASLQFDNQSLFGVAYFWDFGDNTQSDEENPSHTYQEKGLYSVTLTAYNSYFVCPTETTVLINIIPDGSLFIPNVFTPNGDNRNDFFFVGGEGMPIFQLEIFDQWGRSIKSFESFTDRWDGNNKNGYPMPEGVYVYRVQGVFNDGQKIERAGTITLVR